MSTSIYLKDYTLLEVPKLGTFSYFYYLYKITNKLNNKIYIGVHSTKNLDDGYAGSGKLLHKAYKKYGIDSFSKEILEFFDTAEEMFSREKELVDKNFVLDENTYNLVTGGRSVGRTNMVTVIDHSGSTFYTFTDDPLYLNGTDRKSVV